MRGESGRKRDKVLKLVRRRTEQVLERVLEEGREQQTDKERKRERNITLGKLRQTF